MFISSFSSNTSVIQDLGEGGGGGHLLLLVHVRFLDVYYLLRNSSSSQRPKQTDTSVYGHSRDFVLRPINNAFVSRMDFFFGGSVAEWSGCWT